MRSGPMVRLPAREKFYKTQRQKRGSDACPFCEMVTIPNEDVLEETTYCLIVNNPFGYDLWDECGVERHWMIIPKRHVVSLNELTDEERLDYMQQVGRFADEGYSLYARAPGNVTGSVTHQHMHLIKIDNKRKKFLFFLRKPHVVVMK